MKLQTVGPPEGGSLSVVYACPECGYEMAMLTNAYETQIVQSLGVRIGPAEASAQAGTAGGKCPFSAMIPGNEGAGERAPTEPIPVRWTAAAEARLANVPEFVRPMARIGNFYGFYASRVRASRRETEASDVPAEPTTKRRCSPSWARLISKVYHADPLLCRQCGGKLKIIAYVSDEISVKRILAELGLSPPEDEKPPPVRQVVFLPVDEEGREIQVG
jgi:hypothetical protein